MQLPGGPGSSHLSTVHWKHRAWESRIWGCLCLASCVSMDVRPLRGFPICITGCQDPVTKLLPGLNEEHLWKSQALRAAFPKPLSAPVVLKEQMGDTSPFSRLPLLPPASYAQAWSLRESSPSLATTTCPRSLLSVHLFQKTLSSDKGNETESRLSSSI